MHLDANSRKQVRTAACTHALRISGMQPACISCKPVLSVFQFSPPHPVSHGPLYSFLPNCLQLPKRRTDEGKITYLGFSTG